MVFSRLLRRLHLTQRTSISRNRPETFRPQFEQLEPRQMLSATALISGAAIAEAGKAYQLDLSASAPVASWGIDWNNDGTIDQTEPGSASSVTPTAANVAAFFSQTGPVNISALADGSPADVSLLGKFLGALPLSTVPQNPSESVVAGGFLYVADLAGDKVLRYDLANPSASPLTVVDASDGLEGGYGLAVQGNNLYVSGWNVQGAPATAKILKVDLTTLDTTVFADNADGLNGPTGMAFDTSGNLYVANWWTNEVLRFDASGNANPAPGQSGALFVAAGAGGLNTPAGVAFDAGGNLLVTSRNSHQVLTYDGATGAYLGVFGDAGSTRLSNPQGITKGPDGDIYVADITLGRVSYFDGATGQFLGNFEAAPNKGPVNVAFDSTTGYAYVTSRGDTYGGVDSVLKYQGAFSDPAAAPLAVNVVAPSVLVNQATSGLQGENLPQLPGREVGVDANGNSVMVWSDSSGGGVPVIKARLFNAAGQATTSEFQVNTLVTSPNVASLPFQATVAMAADGRFIAVYSGNGSSGFGLYFQRFDALGNKVGSETLFSSGSGGDQMVAYDASGGFIITWTGGTPGHNNVQFQRFNSSGQKVGSQVQVTNKGGDSDIAIATSGPSPGSFAVTWFDTSNSGGLRLQRYSANGSKVGAEITLTSAGDGPTLAYDASGNLAVSYFNHAAGTTTGVAVRVYGPSGNTLLGQTIIDGGNYVSGARPSRPFVAVDKTNHFVIAWMGNDADKEGVFSRRIANISGGVATLDPLVAVSTHTFGSQHGVSVAGTSSGGFVILWKGEGDEDIDGVYAKFFTGV